MVGIAHRATLHLAFGHPMTGVVTEMARVYFLVAVEAFKANTNQVEGFLFAIHIIEAKGRLIMGLLRPLVALPWSLLLQEVYRRLCLVRWLERSFGQPVHP